MTLAERVKKALIDYPHCRDNDSALCGLIWQEDCKKIGKNFGTIPAVEFMHFIDIGELSKHQSILRARRKVNNKLWETRGKSYKPKTPKVKTLTKKAPMHIWRRLDVNGDVDGNILCSHRELMEIHENVYSIKNRHPNKYAIFSNHN